MIKTFENPNVIVWQDLKQNRPSGRTRLKNKLTGYIYTGATATDALLNCIGDKAPKYIHPVLLAWIPAAKMVLLNDVETDIKF